MSTTLLVEDDQFSLRALDGWFRRRSLNTRLASSLEEAREQLTRGPVDRAIVDIRLPDGNGTDLVNELDPATKLILVSGQTSAPELAGSQVCSFLPKPLDLDSLALLLEESGVRSANERPMGPFTGSSRALREVYRELSRIAAVDTTVFISGETGVGKELAARHVHELSSRSHKPFEALNCGALTASLVESELFGHERGSFTGAHRRYAGVFERAAGGTVFLDEVTEMPMELQVKLLRVLETRSLRRVGGDKELPFDVRLVAATNRDPLRAVEEGHLRADLLYRLYVLPIHVPPLRARAQDILELAETFLREWNTEHKTSKQLSAPAREVLIGHDWPGNVRELRNTMFRGYVLSDDEIGVDSIRIAPLNGSSGSGIGIRAGMPMREVERRHLLATLTACDGDKKLTAQQLGISLKTVYNKLKTYELEA